MKVYSIGREMGCDIVINDPTDVISRRHAILNITPSGKMTIVDQSHNGTYVNGIRIAQNVPVPVTRKDNVSFAHVARLEWNMVPKPTSPWLYVIIGLVAVTLIVGGFFAYQHFATKPNIPVVTNDSTNISTNTGHGQSNDSSSTTTPPSTNTTAPPTNGSRKKPEVNKPSTGNNTGNSNSKNNNGSNNANSKSKTKPGEDEKSKTGGRGMR